MTSSMVQNLLLCQICVVLLPHIRCRSLYHTLLAHQDASNELSCVVVVPENQ